MLIIVQIKVIPGVRTRKKMTDRTIARLQITLTYRRVYSVREIILKIHLTRGAFI